MRYKRDEEQKMNDTPKTDNGSVEELNNRAAAVRKGHTSTRKSKKLGRAAIIQLIAAILFTLGVLIIPPSIAWFSYQKEIAVSTKVNSPATLAIRAGGEPGEEQSIINFELSDIDTEDATYNSYTVGSGEGTLTYYYKDFVFCVKGKAISAYDLQLAHTTNIAFKYDIYRAVQDDNGDIVYTSLDKTVTQPYSLKRVKLNGTGGAEVDSGGNVVYEPWTTPLDGAYVNNASAAGTRVLAKTGGDSSTAKDLTARSYDGTDSYQKYANPVYWLKRNIPVYTEEKSDEGFTHSYVLRVSWIMPSSLTDQQREEDLDQVQNNKETDIVYITAAVSS